MREQQMVPSVDCGLHVTAHTRGVQPLDVAEVGAAPWLVLGDPPTDPIPNVAGDKLDVVGIGVGGVAVLPATTLVQSEWQVPMIEGSDLRGASREQAIHQTVIECEPSGIGDAPPAWANTPPCDREAVIEHAAVGGQGNI